METLFPKTGDPSKTYSAEVEGMFRVPLQGLSESKKFRTWTKYKDIRRATRFAQTISPSALTSMSGTSRFANALPKSLCPPSTSAERFSKGGCFLLYRLGKSSNNQPRKTKARPESHTMCKSFRPRRFAVSSACFASLSFRQKVRRERSGQTG